MIRCKTEDVVAFLLIYLIICEKVGLCALDLASFVGNRFSNHTFAPANNLKFVGCSDDHVCNGRPTICARGAWEGVKVV